MKAFETAQLPTNQKLIFQPRLTFDQLPVIQSAGQGMCVLQEDSDSGLGMCAHSLGCRAFCSSTLTAWMQSTVLLVRPELPQLAEHFCHSPSHHLHTETQKISKLMVHLWWKTTIFYSWLTHTDLNGWVIVVQCVRLYRPPAHVVHIVSSGC